MRLTLILFALLCAAFAQEGPQARARELEIRAEKALDEGRRADALKLLAEAAELRAAGTAPVKEPRPPLAGVPGDRAAAADLALRAVDAALAKGDVGEARKAAENMRGILASWATSLAERERKLAQERTPVERRIDELERRVTELKEIAERR